MNGQDHTPSPDDITNRALSDSPPVARRRPLVVHSYENFPFNPNGRSKKKTLPTNVETTPTDNGELEMRSRSGSGTSSTGSIPPPLPERHYSMSEVSSRSRTHNSHTPSRDSSERETRDGLSPLHREQPHSRSRYVKRETSEQGQVYAVVNPAWKKNVKGRSPSLTRLNDTDETPPTSNESTSDVFDSEPISPDQRNEDPGNVRERREEEEGEGGSRFASSARYVDIELQSGCGQAEAPRPRKSVKGGGGRGGGGGDTVTYDTITFHSQPDGAVGGDGEGKVRKKKERWMKTQSAHISSSSSTGIIVSSPTPPPLPLPRKTTPSRDSTPNSRKATPTRDSTPKPNSPRNEANGLVPAVPHKASHTYSLHNNDITGNDRRLHEMNVTIRRPSESEKEREGRRERMSKEALLLRSGVTLRMGTQPPRLLSLGGAEEEEEEEEEEVDGGGRGGSREEEDGLEPVSRAIQSLETRISGRPVHHPRIGGGGGGGGGEGEKQEEAEGDFNLLLVPDGPPKWTQFQRSVHRYEDIHVSNGPSGDGTAKSGLKLATKSSSTRSVGNLHNMVWDESDMRSQPLMVKPEETKEDERKMRMNQLVSASQPCLVADPSLPHLVKPNRVSDEAFQLRKLRLQQHKYEDIDIPEWVEVGVGVAPGTSVGDVPSPAVRNSWLEAEKESGVTDSGTLLPRGWQKMTDEQKRTYYWHIPSGQTQYNKPTGELVEKLSLSLDSTSQALSDQSDHSASASSSTTTHTQLLPKSKVKGSRFSVRYLGNHPVNETELVPGECVKVVHQSIKKTNALPNTKGRPLFLVIQGMELQWMEPESSSPTTIQPINRIRVWGIGLENDRDFGYVARDQVTKKHKCHVFRCDVQARVVAKALLENHQKMNKQQTTTTTTTTPSLSQTDETTINEGRETAPATSPQKIAGSPIEAGSPERTQTVSGGGGGGEGRVRGQGSPPAEGERGESMGCVYMGSCEVLQPQGIEVLNAAVEKLCSNKSRWSDATINISTSRVKISDPAGERTIGDHRIRYLCFLGIAKDDRYCGYILESSARGRSQSEKRFLFHGFKMEPNTDQLCLALHTACQTRYQRVMEQQNQQTKQEKTGADRSRSKSTSSILGRLGSFKKTRKDEDSKVFTVQYLGSQQVSKSEGLEVVKAPIQQLSIPKASVGTAPVNLVEFEVSSAGLGMIDLQKRLFSRKNFSVKHITYVVRIRNYFAFVVREGSKYQCHVFLESSVPAATIVTTIQKMLAPETGKKR